MPWTVNPSHGYLEYKNSAAAIGAVTNLEGDDGTIVTPNGSDTIFILGETVTNATNAQPVYVVGDAGAFSETIQVQVAVDRTGSPADKNDAGLASFNDTQFAVDANGYVSLVGGTDLPGIQTVTGDDGTARGPDASGNIDLTGLVVTNATHAKPLYVNGGLNAEVIELQVATAITGSPTDTNDCGICSFDDTQFTADANGYISLVGGASLPAVQTLTGDDSTPVGPDGSGNIDVNGLIVANATNAKPLYFNGGTNAQVAELQISAAITGSPADTNDAGICSFDDSYFTIDANGYVSLLGTGAGQTITGDSGGALSPTAGNWNILGGPGVTTSGSGSTLTINSVVYTDQGAGTSVISDSGSFATAAIALTTPASPSQGELLEFVCTTSGDLAVTAAGSQIIQIGTLSSSAGGTATSTADGDALVLRYRSSDTTWYAISVIGTWVMA